METPTNPMLNVLDIEAVSKKAKEAGAMMVVDNTFATPYLQRPLDLGADVVMHSGTKYLGGHSDVVLGLLATADKDIAEKMYFIQNASGAILGPMDSFIALRGIKTLHVRMDRHCENGAAVAHFLAAHPAVGQVFWPGLEGHNGHEVAKRQMKKFGGMVSFTVKNEGFEKTAEVVSALKVITLAESLGGVESLACHPASMTHASIPKKEREKVGVTDNLIRLSVGIEHVDDLLADLEQALDK
jgi:cystathionine beta-lyase/cystathionine gamma-synthase